MRGAHPIHGFLSAASEWQVVEAKADGDSAWVTSRLEFFRQPAWMAQFPFAHTIEMTHRLQDGALEIATRHRTTSAPSRCRSLSGSIRTSQLPDAPRDDVDDLASARAREWVLAPDKIPTGETQPIEQRFPNPRAAALRDHDLDHVSAISIRDRVRPRDDVGGRQARRGLMWCSARTTGRRCVYAPKGRDFICFEPMAGITDALNLAQRGVYKDLQHVPPNGRPGRELLDPAERVLTHSTHLLRDASCSSGFRGCIVLRDAVFFV